jgi:iron complex outermembrane receptor protein
MRTRMITLALAAGASIAAISVPAQAQSAVISYDIPAGSLKSALDAYGRQSGRPVIYRSDQVRGITSHGYRGPAQPDEALNKLLAGTGLAARGGEAGSVAIVRVADGQQPSSAPEAAGEDADIVVTARRREETLRDVPAALTAFSSRDLEETGADDFDDYAVRVPGLGFTDLGAVPIRGQGPVINIRGIPDAGYYIGETPIPSANLKLVDINRVEVLKGPQGTLYGTSSMGGLVKVVPNAANPARFEARGETTLSTTKGGGFNYDVSAMVNAPIVKDQLALRVVAYKVRKDGYVDKVPALDSFGALDIAGTIKGVNVEKVWGVRGSLVAKPTDWLDIELSALHEDQRTDDPGFVDTFVQNATGRLGNLSPITEPAENKVSLFNMTLRADAGPFEIISSTSHYRLDSFSREDRSLLSNIYVSAVTVQGPAIVAGAVAGGALPPGSAVVGPPNTSFFSKGFNTTDVANRRWMQEVRLSSTGQGPLRWTVGGFFQDATSDQYFYGEMPGVVQAATLSVNAPGLGVIPLPLLGTDVIINRTSEIGTRELGLFADASYTFAEKLTFNVGGRYYKTRVNNLSTDLTSSIFVPVVNNFPRASITDSGFAPKVNLSYRPNQDTLFYGQVSKGFRSSNLTNTSGFSPTCAQELNGFGITRGDTVPLKSDTLWSYEAGAKVSGLGRKLFVDTAVFYNKWSDLQQYYLLQCGATLFVNAGKARSYGAELAIDARPADGLSLGLAAGYLNTEITESDPRSLLRVGDGFTLAPKWTFAANTKYGFNIGSSLNAYVRADWQYQTKTKFDFQNTPTSAKPSFQVVNLRTGLVSDRWDVSLFVDNLFNEEAILADLTYAVAAGVVVPLGTDNRRIRPFTPRTIGVNMSMRF